MKITVFFYFAIVIFVLAATILNKEYRCAHHWDHCDDQGRFLYGATSFMLAESILVLLICLWTINETAAFITKTKGCCPCCYEKYTHSAAETQVRQFEVFLLFLFLLMKFYFSVFFHCPFWAAATDGQITYYSTHGKFPSCFFLPEYLFS